ncbi:MAG: hypothetical protein ACKV2V_17515 [Blastocatellia bacterium]
MNTRKFSILFTILFLFALGVTAQAQQQKTGKTVITTPAKMVISKIRTGEADAYDVRGKAALTFVSANMDDTITGNLSYAIPDDARQKIASMSGKALKDIPATVNINNVVARFQPATACPVVHLEFSPTSVQIAGVETKFGRFVLDVNESTKEQDMLVCLWARQINRGMARRGIIRKLNEMINGVEEEPQSGN